MRDLAVGLLDVPPDAGEMARAEAPLNGGPVGPGGEKGFDAFFEHRQIGLVVEGNVEVDPLVEFLLTNEGEQ